MSGHACPYRGLESDDFLLGERAQRGSDRLGVKAYTDVRELVSRETLDVCDVVVPGELHDAVSCYL